MGEAHVSYENGINKQDQQGTARRPCLWYEEEIDNDLRWTYSVSRVLHRCTSKYQDIALMETGPFGKVLLLDGKMQSAEVDEFVYHESLVHPALLCHSNPQSVFIMGGGEGSTAREVLKHKGVTRVVMCDIDRDVVNFCRSHLPTNREAFHNKRLELVISDARAELERRTDKFDVIIGDLADPVEGGPCYQLYTKSFYHNVIKSRLNPRGGIFVTQAGPAGILSHKDVFPSIHNTLHHVFKYVVPYAAHIPSFSDEWGWVMASDCPIHPHAADNIDSQIHERIIGSGTSLRFLDGQTLIGLFALNKKVRQSLAKETHIYTEQTPKYIYGSGTYLY